MMIIMMVIVVIATDDADVVVVVNDADVNESCFCCVFVINGNDDDNYDIRGCFCSY